MKPTHRLLALVVLLASFATSAVAQETSADTGRSTEFQAVEGRSTEEVSGFGVMVASYGIILLLFFGYAARIAALQSRTSDGLAELEKQLREGGTDGPR